MATAAPPTTQEEQSVRDAAESLSPAAIEQFLTHAQHFLEKIETKPNQTLEQLEVDGIQGKPMLRLLQVFVAENWKTLEIDPSIIDLETPEFLRALLPALRAKKQILEKNSQRVRTINEIVEEYNKQQTATTDVEKAEHKKHIVHLHQDIEKATENAQKEMQQSYVEKHIDTVEELTNRLTSQVEETRTKVAQTILQDKNFMDALSPILPPEGREQSQSFLAEYIAENIQHTLADPQASVTLASDVSPGRIKEGVLNALSQSEDGRKIATQLNANTAILDGITKTIIDTHAQELATSARYSRSIEKIFASVGADRLQAFIEESGTHLNHVLFREIQNTLGIDPKNTPQIKTLTDSLRRTLEVTLHAQPLANIQDVTKRFLIENQSRYAFLQTSQDINRLAFTISRNNERLLTTVSTAKRLQALSYAKSLASENISLLSQVEDAPFPTTLLPRLSGARTLGRSITKEDRLLGLLCLDEETTNTLLSTVDPNDPFAQKVKAFQNQVKNEPALASRIKDWHNARLSKLVDGPLSFENPNFQALVKNVFDLARKRYNRNVFLSRLFGMSQPYTGPPLAYLHQKITNVFRPKFFATDLVFRKGKLQLVKGASYISLRLGIGKIPFTTFGQRLAFFGKLAPWRLYNGFLRIIPASFRSGVKTGISKFLTTFSKLLGPFKVPFIGAAIGSFFGSLTGIPGADFAGGVIGFGVGAATQARLLGLGASMLRGFLFGLTQGALLGARLAGAVVLPIIANPVTITIIIVIFFTLLIILSGALSGGVPGLPVQQPTTGGTLDYTIPIRDTSVTVTNPDAKNQILREFPSTQLQYWDTIVSQSINNGWNPAFVLTLWIEETGASHHAKISVGGGGVSPLTNGHLGCAPAEDQTIDESLRCLFRNFSSYSNDQFEAFMRRYSGEAATGPFLNNPNFPSRVRRYYSLLVPGGVVPVAPSATATCPVLQTTQINCGSLFSPKQYNQNLCAIGPAPEYGHCSTGYGTCNNREQNRRAKAIDLAAPSSTAVYLPLINNEHFTWVYAGLGNNGNALSSDDGGGYIRGFKPSDTRQHKWYIYFMHVERDFPPLSIGQEISAGQVGALVADTKFDHAHVNIGWDITNFLRTDNYDPGWKKPDVELGMCTGS